MAAYDPGTAIFQAHSLPGHVDVNGQCDYLENCQRLGLKSGDNFEIQSDLIGRLRKLLNHRTATISIEQYETMRAQAVEVQNLKKKIEYARASLRYKTWQLDQFSRREHELRLARLQGASAAREEIKKLTHRKP